MRIVSLAPFLSDAIISFGLEKQLVGVTSACQLTEEATAVLRLDKANSANTTKSLCNYQIDLQALKSLQPDIILTSIEEQLDSDVNFQLAKELVKLKVGENVKLISFYPRTLEQVFETFTTLGKLLNCPKAHDLSQRLKAQLMSWSDNFYARMKNKRVSFISSAEPLKLAGFWVPDMISLCSAVSQLNSTGQGDQNTSWPEIVKFKPDVLLVALRGLDLKSSSQCFKVLEKLPDWETVPAVKRGEVIFTDGAPHFYTPSTNLLESMSILVSAIAGFDSGYIAPRDSFYRLRWLEMQRHKL